MVKKGQKTTRKKGEFFFNFNQLRRKLNSKQKDKLIKFFTKFRTMFINVKQHLFQVNKMYDLMEQEYKKFQKDLFKNDEYLSGPNQEDEKMENSQKEDEFFLDDDVMKQILEEGIRDEKKNDNKEEKIELNKEIKDKNILEKYDIDLGEELLGKEKEKENEEKKNEKNEISQ